VKPPPQKKDLESKTIVEIRALGARHKIPLPRQATKSGLIQTFLKEWKKIEKKAEKQSVKPLPKKPPLAQTKSKKIATPVPVDKVSAKKKVPQTKGNTVANKAKTATPAPKKLGQAKELASPPTKTPSKKPLKAKATPRVKPKVATQPYKPVARAEDDWQQPQRRDNITLLLRDPQWLYAYWHIQPQTIDQLQKRHKKVDFNQARLHLRIFEILGTDAQDKELIATYFPYSGAHAYYMHVPGCGRCYQCEIGFETMDGDFLKVTSSNQVGTPKNTLSEVFDSSWITLENYKKVFSETPAAFKDLEAKRYLLEEALQKAGESWSGGIQGGSEMLTALSSEALAQLSSYIIGEISSFNLNQVSSAMIGELSSKIIHALSSEILSSLSSQVLSELSSQAIHEISSQEMQSLSSEVFQSLSSQSLETLSSEVLQSLSSQVIQSLSSQAVGQLASQVFQELSETAWSQIASEVLGGLASQVFSGMASELFQSLASQVLPGLSSQALQSMTSELQHSPTSSFALSSFLLSSNTLSSNTLSSQTVTRVCEPVWEEPTPTWAIPSSSERVLPLWSSFKVPSWPRGN